MRKFLIIFSFLFIPIFSFAYNDSTTHPALTQEIVEFYNYYFQGNLARGEINLIKQGSTNEDAPPRYVNHFYDPIYNEGWKGELLKISNKYLPSSTVLSLTKKLWNYNSISPSYLWIKSQKEQVEYPRYFGNQTWQKAIYEYAFGDKKLAFLALGHILHNLEDASVPEHTRNDTHVPELGDNSPYEDWAHEYTKSKNNNLDTAESLIKENKIPLIYSTAEEYFYNLAKYTNENFFSKDTIKIEKYKLPRWTQEKIVETKDGKLIKIGFYNDMPLVFIKKTAKTDNIFYSIENSEIKDFILSSYFSHLSRQSILHGAGLLNFFFQEVEKVKKNPELAERPVENAKIGIISPFGEYTKIKSIVKTVYSDFSSQLKTLISQSTPSPAGVLSIPETKSEGLSKTESPTTLQPQTFNPTSNIEIIQTIPTTFYQEPQRANLEAELPSSEIPTYIYAIPPAKKSNSSIIGNYGLIAIPSAAGAGGGGEVAQQPQQVQPQTQSQQNQSPVLDTTPPTINSFSILECQNSLSSQSCFIATTTVNLVWSSNNPDLDYYELTYNNTVSTTTAASAVFIFQNNATNSVSLRAKDKSNNWSATSTVLTEINTTPVVINEIAWMGTATDSSDEWIELYNQTNRTINMESLVLYSETNLTPYIKLASSTSPSGYYLLERTNDSAVPGIAADKIYTGALNDSGEIIILAYVANNATTTLDRTILNSNGAWPAGDNNTNETMQKNENSWCTAIATPKAENNCQNRVNQSPPADTTPPNPPTITSPASFSQTFTSAVINFQGAAEANSTITANYLLNNSTTTATTTVSNLGVWSLSLTLNQGTTTINFYAKDSAQNQSQATSAQLFIDSIGPTIDAFSITECSSGQNCQVATTTLHLLWNSSDSDMNYYELSYGNNISTTTSTSTILTLQDNTAYSFSLRAKDRSGNWSATSTKAVSINIPVDNTPPNAPVIALPANFNQTFASSTINFQGTAEASSTIQAIYLFSSSTTTATTTASSADNWSLTLSLNQATTTINFYSVDQSQNTSSSTPAILFIDSLGPEISSFVISQCSASLSSDGCLTATTTLNLVWSSSNQDINYYELSYGSNTSTTTATSTALTLADNSSYNFSLRAVDLSGNWSATSTASAEISVMPVVINEIGWMGTGASYPNDEFIELYNRTSKTINLTNFVLYSNDLTPYINFDSTNLIASSSYYLIERKNTGETDESTESPIQDIAADLWTSFSYGLNNSGETLSLVYVSDNSTTTIDYVPPCGSSWCAGALYSSMERIDTDVAGSSSSNWATNNGIIRNGKNAGGTAINATPKQRNSANSLISVNTPIDQDITLAKNRSPYFIENTLTLNQGKTLTIDPGVVIKFKEGSGVSLNINGNLYVQGSQSEPVVFTSFRDDNYGGDLNGDASSTSPVIGNNWKEVYLSPTSSSTINYARFRYGGGYSSGDSSGRALLRIDQATSTIQNSFFEYSYVSGLKTIISNALISGNTFSNNNSSEASASGLLEEGGASAIINNTFENNKMGLYLANSLANVQNNVFNNNQQKAIYVSSKLPNFSNNSGSGNGYNGIILDGFQTQANSTTTLAANSLPFILDGYSTVVSSSTLVIASPNQIKANSNAWIRVIGRLIAEGATENDIVFSSNSATPATGDWYGLRVESGYLNLKGTTIKYAGKNVFGGTSGGLVLENSTAKIENSAFENNKNTAIYMSGSNLTLNTINFANNDMALNAPDWPAGSTVNSSNITFQNNTSISSPAGIF